MPAACPYCGELLPLEQSFRHLATCTSRPRNRAERRSKGVRFGVRIRVQGGVTEQRFERLGRRGRS